jgi:hypothetical protein
MAYTLHKPRKITTDRFSMMAAATENFAGSAFPLGIGSNDHASSGNVHDLQNALNKLNNAGLSVDGIFASATDKALSNYDPAYDSTRGVSMADFNAMVAMAGGNNSTTLSGSALDTYDPSQLGDINAVITGNAKPQTKSQTGASNLFNLAQDFLVSKNGTPPVQNKQTTVDPNAKTNTNKTSTVLGLPPAVAIIGGLAVAALVTWGVVSMVRHSKGSSSSGQAAAPAPSVKASAPSAA